MSIFLDAFNTWAEKHESEYPPATTYVWICAFCNNQYRIFDEKDGSGADNLEQVFESRLNGIKRINGRMVAVLDRWQQPPDQSTTYTERLWCIYEQYTAQKLEIPVDITLPKKEADDFLRVLTEGGGLKTIKEKVSRIDCMNAKASSPTDEEKVKGLIKDLSDDVNKAVKQRFNKWCSEALEASLNSEVD